MRILPERYDRLRRDAGVGTLAVAAGILVLWLVPATLAGFESYVLARLSGRDYPVWRAFMAQAPAWLAFGALTPLILAATERLPLHTSPRLPRLLAHGGLALLAGVVYALAATVAWRTFSPYPQTMPFGRLALSWYLSSLPVTVLAYFGVVGAALALHWFLRHRQAELDRARLAAQLSEARLGALRMQLHPHFLFNTLNAATVLVRDGHAPRAESVLEGLGRLLRRALREDRPHHVALDEELAFIRDYLAVEQVRFSDRLRVLYDVDPGLDDALVPALIFQPLVENAVRHGISRRGDAGRLELRARAAGDQLVLEVVDDGPGPGGSDAAGAGVGLANTRARLAVLYDARARCELLPGSGGGAVARVTIPLERRRGPVTAGSAE